MNLGTRAVRGAGITLVGQAGRFVLQLGSLPILARLLSPADFGVVAAVTAVTGVAELIRDFGLSSAAIQARTINNDERTNLLWVNTAIGVSCAVIAVALAPALALLYGTATVRTIVFALAGLFVVSGFNTQFRAELSRNLRFSALAVTDLSAMTLAMGTSITMAFLHFGYWSIVGQQAVLVIATCLFNVLQCSWRPGWPRRHVSIRRFFNYGAGVFGTQVIGYYTDNVDNIAIGAYLGPAPLGLYSRAYQLFMVPLSQINASMARVVLPALSRVQDDQLKFVSYLQRAQLVGCYLLATFFAIAAGLCHPIVAVLFGPQWRGVAPIFAVLAVGAVFRGIALVSYWMYLARARTGAQLKMYLATRPIMIGMILAGLPWGPVGVAVGHTAAFVFYWIVSVYCAGRAVGVPSAPLFRQAVKSMTLIAAPAGLIAFGVAQALDGTWLQLLGGVVAAGLYLAVAFALLPNDRATLLDLLGRLRPGAGEPRTGRAAVG